MDQPVQESVGEGIIAEDLFPAGKLEVGGDVRMPHYELKWEMSG